MTATQVRGGKKKWRTNDLPDCTQDAFSKHFCHKICIEAEKAVEAFIAEYADQLSTPKFIGQYMVYIITPTSPGENIEALSPLFM